jgi:hypothetical protein
LKRGGEIHLLVGEVEMSHSLMQFNVFFLFSSLL